MTISLKQLSLLLGLSQTTVSRALNGYPEVSEATRKRVIEAAQRHAYMPNPRARSLATGRAMAIGHVLPLAGPSDMVNPIFADFLAGAGTVYTRRGYGVHLSFAEAGREAEHFRWLTRQRMVDAVVLHSPRAEDERARALADLDIVFGVHGLLGARREGYNYVEMDNRAAMELATCHLAGLGHRRIAFLNGPAGLNFAREREAGFLSVMEARSLVPNRLWMLNDEMSEDYGHRTAQRLCRGSPRPTAFLAGSILVAAGVHRAVLEAGLRVPRDVSIVTHDDMLSFLPNGDPPRLTATRSPVREAGQRLADILIDQVEDRTRPPRGVILAPELVLGASTGPAPAEAPA
ncbi:LacI family DNA-binding transcriptional regulator [Poseidonocella sp. HB161398]|uniref:LacI family DNA-binding transcriptional regulator n=1 Tax=Poseidonocella sp. HB161398 TaxID=2320855 RepID=UPI00148697ED|nr:substrate-binding domain-containing protein [Poseidonocella sp. HB161398]